MMILTGTLTSEKAPAYLKHLCKQFTRKHAVTSTESEGDVTFDFGSAVISTAGNQLKVVVTLTNDADAKKAQRVFDNHIGKIASQEPGVSLTWA